MKNIVVYISALLFTANSYAQQFIDKAVIEFEVNTNLKKKMSNDSWTEQIKENISDLKTSYYIYTFEDNKSIFKFDRWSEKTRIPNYEKEDDEESIWYFDFTSNKMNIQKQIFGTKIIINDSIANIEWRLTNENREIAGYNCRKAVGKIMNDVYVFAFYTDEITITGGPCSVNGLPGMILGITIPRLYTSYMATKVTLNREKATEIKPLEAKKTYTITELKTLITEKTKDWWTYGDDKEENTRQKNMFMWEAFL
ncbi:GLPGLI family protein [Flavobacterium terrigena]|uniref:GLPGLI family protein n=1 Tax=Flavobacterium terrigena TaxID=402734 RepID=A0A1H6TEX5_9FLAO|nr:GLPGLI family protein [Flavobacterium terrigena]SEI78619.1 GLPGLI family protein [Flavobacterium terrigena]